MVHQFISLAPPVGALQHADAPREDARRDPDVAVEDPQDVALGLPVAAAHVADFWVRAHVLLADNQPDVNVRERFDDLVDHGDGRVVRGRDAYDELIFGLWVVEEAGGRQTGV